MTTTTNAAAVCRNRLEILRKSLARKEALFDQRLAAHMGDVKKANGQPLNDKRNGAETLAKWERQNDSLRALQASIDRTKSAIERETSKIERAASVHLPEPIKSRIGAGSLKQWRKHPNTFFVNGVDKARIVLRPDGTVAHRYSKAITDSDQWKIFARTFNELSRELAHE